MGAVGILGYALSERQPRAPAKEVAPPRHEHGYPFGPGTEVQRLMDADRQATKARWEQSLQPNVTGVVTPNTKPGGPLPFYSSERKQHTNNAMKQRRMETFTGATDLSASSSGTYIHKREVPQMFDPRFTAGAVNFSGGTASTPFGADQASRYVPSQIQNNVLPTQQVRVGKGVGVGVDVPASDGFHPMLRIMPQNLNEHRLNNLPGGVVSGASAIGARPQTMEYAQAGPPRYWDQERYPTAPTKASVNAASERPQQLLEPCGGRMEGEDYFGTAGRTGPYQGATQATRDRDDNNRSVHETNVTQAVHGVGAFAKARHDMTRFDAQGREQEQRYEGMLTGNKGPAANELYLLPQTNRSLHTSDVVGNPASAVEGGHARPLDAMGRTLREHMHPQSQPGVAAPYIKGHSVQATDKWLDRESKRYEHHMVGWMPPPHMSTDVRVPGLVQVKPRLDLPSVAALPTTTTPVAMAPLGESANPHNKLPSLNMRLDLSVAQDQLANNPLHVSRTR